MPTYEYYCRSCHESFSRREKMDEHGSNTPTCPRCQSRDIEHKMSGFYARTARKS